MAPPANRVPELIINLFEWLKEAKDHLLIRSCVFHYEFEFIHPFSDGNGRTGRLWQSLILGKLHPLFEHLPVENMVYANQEAYYNAIQASTAAANSGPFIDFMLQEILDALKNHQGRDVYKRQLVGRYLLEFRDVDVILIFHAHGFLQRFIVAVVHHDNRHFGVNQFLDGRVAQAASFRPPEIHTYRQFPEIILPCPLRQRGQKEIHKLPPCVSFRKFHRLPSHSVGTAIHTGEVDSVHPPDHLAPSVGIEHPVELQALLCLINERTRHRCV